eukprot:CAMPEP_0113918930 /NCGR_PEP_ID=MMETSP0780_2-20120614/33639_1 /TAXON_ID=652834 /ORGANISM="Palpitomonas bilix" /LENGTH=588 /DNA_ID=CAMNT_0000918821 /DNA_START=131 /DNA_END=1897 /DNA_ORIENTATION=- /assembly_acc=CAM_ASM_000599
MFAWIAPLLGILLFAYFASARATDIYPSFPANFSATLKVEPSADCGASLKVCQLQASNISVDARAEVVVPLSQTVEANGLYEASLKVKNTTYLLWRFQDNSVYSCFPSDRNVTALRRHFFLSGTITGNESVSGEALERWEGFCDLAFDPENVEKGCKVWTQAGHADRVKRIELGSFLNISVHSMRSLGSSFSVPSECRSKFSLVVGYVSFSTYVIVALLALARAGQSLHHVRLKRMSGFSPAVLFSPFLFLSCAARAYWFLENTYLDNTTILEVVLVVNRVSIMLLFTSFSFVIFFWAAIPFRTTSTPKRSRPSSGNTGLRGKGDKVLLAAIVVVNIVMIGALGGDTALVASNAKTMLLAIYHANLVFIASTFVLLSFGFLIFGLKLYAAVHKSAQNTKTFSSSSRNIQRKADKILALTSIFFICNIVRAFFWTCDFLFNITVFFEPDVSPYVYPWLYYQVPDIIPGLCCLYVIRASPEQLKKDVDETRSIFARIRRAASRTRQSSDKESSLATDEHESTRPLNIPRPSQSSFGRNELELRSPASMSESPELDGVGSEEGSGLASTPKPNTSVFEARDVFRAKNQGVV